MVPRAREATNGRAHAAEVSDAAPASGVPPLPSIGVSVLPPADRTDEGPGRGRRCEAVTWLTLAEPTPPRSRARAPPSRLPAA